MLGLLACSCACLLNPICFTSVRYFSVPSAPLSRKMQRSDAPTPFGALFRPSASASSDDGAVVGGRAPGDAAAQGALPQPIGGIPPEQFVQFCWERGPKIGSKRKRMANGHYAATPKVCGVKKKEVCFLVAPFPSSLCAVCWVLLWFPCIAHRFTGDGCRCSCGAGNASGGFVMHVFSF